MSLELRVPHELHVCRSCHEKRRLNVQKWSERGVFWPFWLRDVLRPTTAWTFWTSQRPKVVWDCQCLTLLWSKCATACIFSTSQLTRALQTRNVFNQPFDFQICFAPQPRALFQRLTTTQWFQHFDFQMCFAPQPHAVFKILTWKCASRHNSVHFLNISTFKRAPSMRSFSILTSKCTSHHSRVRFLSSTIPKVPPNMQCFGHLTSKFASRHSGVHLSQFPKVLKKEN